MQVHILSFEGPDAYARAGGLATRVTGLAAALAAAGCDTHLWFIGDPALPGHEPVVVCGCTAGVSGSAATIRQGSMMGRRGNTPTMRPRCRHFCSVSPRDACRWQPR